MLKKIDKTLLITSIILFVFGLVMIFSASNVVASYVKQKATTYYFTRQALFIFGGLAVSFAALLIFGKFGKHRVECFGKLSNILLFGFMGLLVYLLLAGKITNQAKSWINIFGVRFQPSEFIKVICIIWMGFICGTKLNLINPKDNKEKVQLDKINNKKFYGLIVIVVVAITILIAFQPDWGTAAIFIGTLVLTFLCSIKMEKRVILPLIVGIFAIAVLVLIFLVASGEGNGLSRQVGRITNFVDNLIVSPCSDEKFYDSGTQLCNGYIAFNNGGLLGKGLGNSSQKYLYLPEAYTDFIFAIVVEEVGFLGGLAVLILIFIVLWRIFIIGKKSKSGMGKIICTGVFWYILIHVVVNLGGITGILPLTGVPFPFISYGGSYAICLVVSLTFVQMVCIQNGYENEKKIEK